MSTPTDTYRRELLTALRMRGVHPDRIGEALAEVDSHVAESREDPAEAFGPPRTYAESFPKRDADAGFATRAVRGGLTALAGAISGVLGATGVVGVVRGEDALGGPAALVLIVGLVAAAVGCVALAGRAGVVHDPRTRMAVDPDGRRLAPVLFALFVLFLLMIAGITALTG